jgi:hypothetical protein
MYLTEAGVNRSVTSIASVSGGSFANGVVAQQLEYEKTSQPDLDQLVGRVARQIAGPGTALAPALVKLYVAAVLLALVAALVGPWFLPLAGPLQGLALLVGLLLVGWLASFRGRVAGWAFGRTLLTADGASPLLRDVHTEIDHVLCATDLHAGEHVYLSGRFVCSYRFGYGRPADLPLRTAVQASAAFPGVFPVTWRRTAPHRFQQPGDSKAASAKRMALVDGGVYDNMADQWAQGLAARERRWKDLQSAFRACDELVVVNASAGMEWSSVAALRLPLLGELLSLLRDKSVLYDNGNSVRRRELVTRFETAERDGEGMRGALVHIPQSPFKVPDGFASTGEQADERARRANDVLARLEGSGKDAADVREEWRQTAEANAAVATTLVPLKKEVCARLLHHGYVLAMANLHVLLGYPLHEVPDRERFARLLDDPPSAA